MSFFSLLHIRKLYQGHDLRAIKHISTQPASLQFACHDTPLTPKSHLWPAVQRSAVLSENEAITISTSFHSLIFKGSSLLSCWREITHQSVKFMPVRRERLRALLSILDVLWRLLTLQQWVLIYSGPKHATHCTSCKKGGLSKSRATYVFRTQP